MEMITLDFFSIKPEENLPMNMAVPERFHVHIWQLHHESIPQKIIDENLSFLSLKEKKRAQAFHFDHDRDSYILSSAFLRKILSSYTGIPPTEINYVHGTHGKPGLQNTRIKFNTSHSHHLIVYGVTVEDEIGIDVEYMKPLRDSLVDIVNQQFTLKERDEFRKLNPHEQKLYFFRTWTKKEAYLKAVGTGLYGNLLSIESEMTEIKQDLIYGRIGDHTAPLSSTYVEFPTREDYAASLVIV